MNKHIVEFGGRKFLMTIGCSVINTLLLVNGYIDQSTYKELIIATVAVYIGGNTFQKLKQNPNKYNGDKDGTTG